MLSLEAAVTLQQLAAVGQQLEYFEERRVRAIEQYRIFLLIPVIHDRYAKAVLHHRELCTGVQERKMAVAAGAGGSELIAIEEWCQKTESALRALRETVEYAEIWGRVPRGWTPPEGFEYLTGGTRSAATMAATVP